MCVVQGSETGTRAKTGTDGGACIAVTIKTISLHSQYTA